MFNKKKLKLTSLAVTASVFLASICANAAQIESLSVEDNTLYATTDASNSRLYVAEYNEGLLVDAFFGETDSSGNISFKLGTASEYKVFLWDKSSLAPICVSYNLKDGVCYRSDTLAPVPEYSFTDYSFNQEDNVMIVSQISPEAITGYKQGTLVTYSLAPTVTVLGLSDKISDVTPGSVVMIGTNRLGNCSAIELLASLGYPVNSEKFISSYGTYSPADGSTRYKNIVGELYSKSGKTIKLPLVDENGNIVKTEEGYYVPVSYTFDAKKNYCYRVGIAKDDATDTPIISCTTNTISTYPSIFESTSSYKNFLYLRYDTETEKIVECVYYCVPKNFNPGAGDDEYSGIFGLDTVTTIIK